MDPDGGTVYLRDNGRGGRLEATGGGFDPRPAASVGGGGSATGRVERARRKIAAGVGGSRPREGRVWAGERYWKGKKRWPACDLGGNSIHIIRVLQHVAEEGLADVCRAEHLIRALRLDRRPSKKSELFNLIRWRRSCGAG